MSEYRINTEIMRLPTGTKLVRLSVTLKDGDIHIALLLSPGNTRALGQALIGTAREAESIIDLSSAHGAAELEVVATQAQKLGDKLDK